MDTAAPLVIERQIPGPPEDVFNAWLDPQTLPKWMCPGDIVRTTATLDPRVGGEFRIEMKASDGQTFVHRGVYLEIESPRRLVFTWISDATGNQASRVTVEFIPHGIVTNLRLTHERLPAASAERHRDGWNTILEKLASHSTEAKPTSSD